MSKRTLVVMAAGMGSRYGGLKQIDPVGPAGEILLEYSLHDALAAGFDRVVFVIKRQIESVFQERVGRRVARQVDTRLVFQEVDALPSGFSVPEGRVKPWGTGHAVLVAAPEVSGPFAVINGDDFYGRHAFQVMADCLDSCQPGQYAMVGYPLANTLTEHGHVSRGVCLVDEAGNLQGIVERTHIESRPQGPAYTEDGTLWHPLAAETPVSMNLWGFGTDFLQALAEGFPAFLEQARDNPMKAEYFLPAVVDAQIRSGRASVKVLPTHAAWFGVTYPEDKPRVQAAIHTLLQAGAYPSPLFPELS